MGVPRAADRALHGQLMSGVALFGETLIKAALADEDGQALDKAIAELGPANSMSPLSALGRGPRATSYLALASAMSEAIRQAQLQFHSRYYADCHVSEAVDMTKGVLLRIFMLEGQRHHGELLYDWLLRRP